MHNLCFSFLLGITVIENNGHEKLWGGGVRGQIKYIMGDGQVAYRHTQDITTGFVLTRQRVLLCHYTVSHTK